MSFKIKINRKKSTPIVIISGDVTGDHVRTISSRLNALHNENWATIAIDLSNTTFIDSHGLGVFVYFWRQLEQEKRRLVFLKPQGFILELFAGTNLDKVFTIIETDEDL